MSEAPPSIEQPSSPQRALVESLRGGALEVTYGAENTEAQAIAAKMFALADAKERALSLAEHAHDVTVYQEFKKLGIFVVRDTQATFDYEDARTGFSLRTGDPYLELHLPPVPHGFRSREAVTESLDMIREYIRLHGLQPKYLMGITYEQLGRFAERRFGFSLAYPDTGVVPGSVMRGVERVYRGFTDSGMDGRRMGQPVIVFRNPNQQPSTQRARRVGGLLSRLLLTRGSS